MLAKLMPLPGDSLAARVQVCEIGSVTQTHTLNLDAKVRNVGSSCTGCLDLVVSPIALPLALLVLASGHMASRLVHDQ